MSSSSEYDPSEELESHSPSPPPRKSTPPPEPSKKRKKVCARKNPDPPSRPRTARPRPSTAPPPNPPSSQPPPPPSFSHPDARFSRWFSNNLQAERFQASFEHRRICSPHWLNLEWFAENGFTFQPLLEKQKLIPFVTMKEPIYPDLVKVFYSTLTLDEESNTIQAFVKGVPITIGPQLWTRLSGLHFTGSNFTGGEKLPDDWTDDYNFNGSLETICHVLSHTPLGQKLKSGSLTVEARILHLIFVKILIGREGNFATVLNDDRLSVWAMIKEKVINWGNYVQHHMEKMTLHAYRTAALPYAMLITKILRHFNVDLSGEACIDATLKKYQLGKTNLAKGGIVFVDDVWMQSGVGHASHMSRELFPDHIQPPSAQDPTAPNPLGQGVSGIPSRGPSATGASSSRAPNTDDHNAILARMEELDLRAQYRFEESQSRALAIERKAELLEKRQEELREFMIQSFSQISNSQEQNFQSLGASLTASIQASIQAQFAAFQANPPFAPPAPPPAQVLDPQQGQGAWHDDLRFEDFYAFNDNPGQPQHQPPQDPF